MVKEMEETVQEWRLRRPSLVSGEKRWHDDKTVVSVERLSVTLVVALAPL